MKTPKTHTFKHAIYHAYQIASVLKPIHYMALASITSILATCILLVLLSTGLNFPATTAWLLLLTICTTSTGLLATKIKILEKYNKSSTNINIVATLITITFALYNAPIADFLIMDFTNVDAKEFPNAQKLITFLITVYSWMFIATPISCISLFWALQHSKKIKADDENLEIYAIEKRLDYLIAAALLLGVSFTIAIVLNFITANKTQEFIFKQSLVYSSFHLTPDSCGITDQHKEARIALLPNGEAIVATPSKEKAFAFRKEKCVLKSIQDMPGVGVPTSKKLN